MEYLWKAVLESVNSEWPWQEGRSLGCRMEPDFSITQLLYHLNFVLCVHIINLKVIVYNAGWCGLVG